MYTAMQHNLRLLIYINYVLSYINYVLIYKYTILTDL